MHLVFEFHSYMNNICNNQVVIIYIRLLPTLRSLGKILSFFLLWQINFR